MRFLKLSTLFAVLVTFGLALGAAPQLVEAIRTGGRRVLAMTRDTCTIHFLRLVFGGVLTLILTLPAAAQSFPQVFPGETMVFDTATDGTENCRFDSLTQPCGPFPLLTDAEATPATNEVATSAGSTVVIPVGQLGVPLYGTASVSIDFEIPGPPDNLVNVQATVKYDFTGNFFALGLYTVENALQLRIEDRSRGEIVASHSLTRMQRQGDQGFTDVSVAEERAVLLDEVAHFAVKLQRGGVYRLHFELQSSAVTFLAGAMRAFGSAKFHSISVSVDEDEVEQLAVHDQDIKALLAEIKRLLLTPPGRRPGFPFKPVKAPKNPKKQKKKKQKTPGS